MNCTIFTFIFAITLMAGSPNYGSIHKNVKYAENDTLTADIYIPARFAASKDGNSNAGTPYPVVIAASLRPSSDTLLLNCMGALEYGYAVIVAGLGDSDTERIKNLCTLVEWVRHNGGGFGLDSRRTVLWGSGRGGYLAAMAGCAGTYLEGYETIMEFGTSEQMASAQRAGASNIEAVKSFGLYNADNSCKAGAMVILLGDFSPDDAKISPLALVTPQSPPLFIIYAADTDKNGESGSVEQFVSKMKSLAGSSLVESLAIPDTSSAYLDNPQLYRAIFQFLSEKLF